MKQKIFTLAVILNFCLGFVSTQAQISNTSTSITINHNPTGFKQQICPWNQSIPNGSSYTMTVTYTSQDLFTYGQTITTSPVSVTVTNNMNGNTSPGQIIIASSSSMGIPTDANNGYSLVTTEGVVKITGGSLSGTWSQSWQYEQLNCDPLPLFLTSFQFDPNYSSNSYFKINWQTLDEHDVSHFVLQRSTNGHTFTDFVLEPSAGPSSNYLNYTVYVNRINATTYYRLKWINSTYGTYEYSKIIWKSASGVSSNPPTNFCSYTSLEGPSTVTCNPATYKIHNAQAGTINWSLSGSYGTVSSTNAGTQAIVTPSSSTYGYGTLTATPSGGCTKSLSLQLGFPEPWGDIWTSADQSIILQTRDVGYNYIYENTWVYFRVDGATSASQYSYDAGTISSPYFDGTYMSFYMPTNSWASFSATVTIGSCTKTFHYDFMAQPYPSYYSVGPNPASSELTIYVDDEKLKQQKVQKSSDQSIQKIMITDRLGNVLMQKTFSADTRKATLNISRLSTDVYVVKIFNGKQWVPIKFFKH